MELTLDQALRKGIEAHRAGNLVDADRHYTAILRVQPEHSDANHNMGVLAVDLGKAKDALPYFKSALASNPNKAQYWLSYIDTLIKLDRLNDARDFYYKAKEHGAYGAGFDALANKLGITKSISSFNLEKIDPSQSDLEPLVRFYRDGDLKNALAQALRLVEKFNQSAIMYNYCGAIYFNLGEVDEAINSYEKAIALKPSFAEAYYNLGKLVLQKDPKRAIKCYKSAIEFKSDYAEA